ncbi:hypothetical protein JY409_04610 [Stenotrophomonas maltophilia]|uniref:hypothetical protein n=1 Tax=Stenotrophomonas maltophilia TaxID=40324 RepID=UPI0007F00B26|nr:hypothetical protein [Stenotrophomonas maltophilia]MBN4937324.1 hypothetical protein [Stenotrophomonas maltophilia]OBU50151.1 hypothetical protein A9K76_08035 [Stenotrophomonas maltophilia]
MSSNDANAQLDRAMNGKFASVALKVAIFALPFVLTVAGSVVSWMLNDIRSIQADQGRGLQQVTSDLQVVNAKLDNGVIWRIAELERRLNTVEQAQKTP